MRPRCVDVRKVGNRDEPPASCFRRRRTCHLGVAKEPIEMSVSFFFPAIRKLANLFAPRVEIVQEHLVNERALLGDCTRRRNTQRCEGHF